MRGDIVTTSVIEDRFVLADAVPYNLLATAISCKKEPLIVLRDLYEHGGKDTKGLISYEEVMHQLLAIENVEVEVEDNDWGFFAGKSRIEKQYYREHMASWRVYDTETDQWLFKKRVVLDGILTLIEIAGSHDAPYEASVWKDLYREVSNFDSSTLSDMAGKKYCFG